MSRNLPSAAPQEPGDAALVRRTTRGDLSAFEELVDRHRPVVVRAASRIAGSEDVSQDAFLRAFHRLDHFRGDAPFRAWLLRITHNAALDHLARRRPEPVDPQAFDASEPSATRPPAEGLELRERIERLERKLHGLSAQHRELLRLVGSQTPSISSRFNTDVVARARAQRAFAVPLRALGGLVAALAEAVGSVVRTRGGRRAP